VYIHIYTFTHMNIHTRTRRANPTHQIVHSFCWALLPSSSICVGFFCTSLDTLRTESLRVAVRCSVLQCGAVCCSVLQCVAVCCSVLQCDAVCFIHQKIAPVVRHGNRVAVCCSLLQDVAVRCSVLQWCCSMLQWCCSVLHLPTHSFL